MKSKKNKNSVSFKFFSGICFSLSIIAIASIINIVLKQYKPTNNIIIDIVILTSSILVIFFCYFSIKFFSREQELLYVKDEKEYHKYFKDILVNNRDVLVTNDGIKSLLKHYSKKLAISTYYNQNSTNEFIVTALLMAFMYTEADDSDGVIEGFEILEKLIDNKEILESLRSSLSSIS